MRGIYILFVSIDKKKEIRIGSLGKLVFEKGLYAYVGSAQNNLEKRIARHFKKRKRVFWHIDYLLSDEHVKIISVFFREAPKSEECHIARALSNLYEYVKGFGSSDCKCPSHLFKINSFIDIEMLLKEFELKHFIRK